MVILVSNISINLNCFFFVEKKASYNTALKSFSAEWKENQEKLLDRFINGQQEIISKEIKEQREWEQRLLLEERQANEQMMTNLMQCFFNNLHSCMQPSQPIPFYQPTYYSFPSASSHPDPSPSVSPATKEPEESQGPNKI